MLIVNNLLLFPVRGLMGVLREVRNAALQEMMGEGERIAAELQELYRKLESGSISEAEFDATERILLDRLVEFEEAWLPAEDPEGAIEVSE